MSEDFITPELEALLGVKQNRQEFDYPVRGTGKTRRRGRKIKEKEEDSDEDEAEDGSASSTSATSSVPTSGPKSGSILLNHCLAKNKEQEKPERRGRGLRRRGLFRQRFYERKKRRLYPQPDEQFDYRNPVRPGVKRNARYQYYYAPLHESSYFNPKRRNPRRIPCEASTYFTPNVQSPPYRRSPNDPPLTSGYWTPSPVIDQHGSSASTPQNRRNEPPRTHGNYRTPTPSPGPRIGMPRQITTPIDYGSAKANKGKNVSPNSQRVPQTDHDFSTPIKVYQPLTPPDSSEVSSRKAVSKPRPIPISFSPK